MSELANVQRIGPALPVMRRICPSCHGTMLVEAGYIEGTNTSYGERCGRCIGGFVEYCVGPQAVT